MYAKTEMFCPRCKRKQMVDTEELRHYDIGCCGGAMQRTGVEEHDDEWAREQNARSQYGEREEGVST